MKRYVRRYHFEQYPWLVCSIALVQVALVNIVHFSQSTNKGGKLKTEPLNKLVTLPLNQYSKLFGKTGGLEVHNSNQCHREAILKSDEFLKKLQIIR